LALAQEHFAFSCLILALSIPTEGVNLRLFCLGCHLTEPVDTVAEESWSRKEVKYTCRGCSILGHNSPPSLFENPPVCQLLFVSRQHAGKCMNEFLALMEIPE
jgi:hypothetical protein